MLIGALMMHPTQGTTWGHACTPGLSVSIISDAHRNNGYFQINSDNVHQGTGNGVIENDQGNCVKIYGWEYDS